MFVSEPSHRHGSIPGTGILLINLGTPAAPTPRALRSYLRQFLFESVLLSGIGGVLGVALGIGAAALIENLTEFKTVIQVSSGLLSLSFSAGVGVFFGYYPARRAARLDPIEALRYE